MYDLYGRAVSEVDSMEDGAGNDMDVRFLLKNLHCLLKNPDLLLNES